MVGGYITVVELEFQHNHSDDILININITFLTVWFLPYCTCCNGRYY
jgi:hypothetical protein